MRNRGSIRRTFQTLPRRKPTNKATRCAIGSNRFQSRGQTKPSCKRRRSSICRRTPRIGENGEAPSQAIHNPTSGAVTQPNSANSLTLPPPATSDRLYMANALDAIPSSKPSKPWRRAIPFKNARPLKASKTATGRKPLKVALTLKAAETTKEDEALSADENALKPTDDDSDASRSTTPVKDGEESIKPFSKNVKSDLKAVKRRTKAAKPFKPTISLLGTKPTTPEAKKEPKIPKLPTSANGLSGKEPPSWGLGPNLLLSPFKAAKPTTPVEAKERNGQEPLAWGLGPASVPTTWGSKKTVTEKSPKVGGGAEEVKGQEPPSWGLGPGTAGMKWAAKWKPTAASKAVEVVATKKDADKRSLRTVPRFSRTVTPFSRAVTPTRVREMKDGVFKAGKATKTATPIRVPKKTRAVQPRKKMKPGKARR